MPKILSVDSKHEKPSKRNLLRIIREWILSLDKFTKLYLITIILLTVATPAMISGYLIFTQQAAETAIPGDINERKTLVDLINEYRVQNGKIVLAEDQILTSSSCWMAKNMADNNRFDHIDSLGRNPAQRMQVFGLHSYEGGAENLGQGYQTAQAVLNAWKNSSEHNSNMLLGSMADSGGGQHQIKRIGVGVAYNSSNPQKYLWAMNIATADYQSISPLSALSGDCSYLPPNNPPIGTHDTVDNTTCNTRDGHLIRTTQVSVLMYIFTAMVLMGQEQLLTCPPQMSFGRMSITPIAFPVIMDLILPLTHQADYLMEDLILYMFMQSIAQEEVILFLEALQKL